MTTFTDPILQAFITDHSEEKRRNLVMNIKTRYSGRVPVLIGRADLKNTPKLNKSKYLVPRDLTFGKFLIDIRKNLDPLHRSQALFFFLSDSTLVPSSAVVSSLYDKHKAKDGFLYITYAAENTFGQTERTN